MVSAARSVLPHQAAPTGSLRSAAISSECRARGLAPGGDASAAQDGEVVGERESLRRVVRREDDGPAAVGDRPHDGLDERAALYVETGVRLVEQEQGGAVQQRPRDGDALLHAVGESAHAAARPALRADVAQHLGGALVGVGHAVKAGVEAQVLLRREVVVEEAAVAGVAGGGADALSVAVGVEARRRHAARARLDERGGDAQERALARAVVPEEHEHAPPRRVEVDGAQCVGAAVGLGDAAQLQRVAGARGGGCGVLCHGSAARGRLDSVPCSEETLA